MPVARIEFSTKVRRSANERADGRCEWTQGGFRCEAILGPGNVHFDHRIPFAISRDSSLENCDALCKAHHAIKTAKIDIPTIAKGKRVADKYIGIRKPATIPGRGFAPPAPKDRTTTKVAPRRPLFEDA